MPVDTAQKELELGLRDYLLIIYKRRWVMLGVFLLVSIFNTVSVNRQIPIYRAVASVRILERKTVATLLTDWLAYASGDPISSQAKIIESYPVIERVAKELSLVKKDATSEEMLRAVTSLQGRIKAMPLRETNVITISVEDKDRHRAALIANEVVQAYIEENLKEKAKQARTVKEFIEKQLGEVGKKLRNSEDAIKEFHKSGQATGVAIPLQNRLADLETEKLKLLRLYTEKHPQIIKVGEEIDMVKEQIKTMPDSEIQFARLSREVEINEGLYKGLQAKFEDARIAEVENVPDVTLVNPASVPSGPIRPNKPAAIMLGIITGLFLGGVAGFVLEHLDTSIGTIEDVERYLELPVVGVIPYLRVEEENKEKIHPLKRLFSRKERQDLTKEMLRKQLLIYYSSQSPIAEAYRILRTNIIIEILKNQTKGKIILITSAGPGEGKSINVANLGISLAQSGLKVLIIDADLRRAAIDRIFGFTRQAGLADILRQTVKLEDAIHSIVDFFVGDIGFEKTLSTPGMDNLSILLSGGPAVIPTELLASPEMTPLLEKLKERFDIILLDSPPVLAVADPAILAPKVDVVLLVYKVGKTASSAIMRAKKQLEAVAAPAKGIILNNISPEVEIRSQYYYYKYRYYSHKEQK